MNKFCKTFAFLLYLHSSYSAIHETFLHFHFHWKSSKGKFQREDVNLQKNDDNEPVQVTLANILKSLLN